MKLVFMGTAAFAVPSLEALCKAGHEVALVVAQPDRPSGRGMQVKAPPLKEAALRLGLDVYQPEKVKEPEALARIAALRPDYLCVVAYGQILPQALLDVPARMPLNVHASLLPKYRGAAPIEWAVARGEAVTGVSVQKMVLKMDAGPVLLSTGLKIRRDETAPELTARLAPLGAEALVKALRTPDPELQAQDEAVASYAPLLKKQDGAADFGLTAKELYSRFRGFVQRPGFCFGCQGEAVRVHQAAVGQGGGKPGELLEISDDGLLVACKDGALRFREVQGPGARRMAGAEWARGKRIEKGAMFTAPAWGG